MKMSGLETPFGIRYIRGNRNKITYKLTVMLKISSAGRNFFPNGALLIVQALRRSHQIKRLHSTIQLIPCRFAV